MKHIQIYSWLAISGLLTLAACSSTSTVKQSAAPVESNSGFDPLKYGESKQPTTFDNDVKTKITNLKTIAVTDISYSQEFRDAFYFEENKIKRSDAKSESKSQVAPVRPFEPIAPATKDNDVSEKPTSNIQQKRQYDDKSVYMHNVGFMKVQATLDDLPSPPLPPEAPGNNTKEETQQNNSNSNQSESMTGRNFEHSYTKKYGIERKINYGEIRGLSGPIKGMLLKAGYKVIQGKPNVARIDQNDDYFDIIKRIEAGDFNGADYVLYGVLTGLTQNAHSSPITGTTNTISINDLEIAIDFSLIDTKTHRVVASFIASGSATDNRIDGEAEGYKPNTTKMVKQLSGNLSESVAYHLASQDFITSELAQVSNSPRVIPGTDKYRYDERNLRVYK
jgi:hypothetical protein